MNNKMKVLIVEDEILTAQSIKMDLEEFGVDVLKPVAKGEAAIEVAIQENPSLILMDIRLAGEMDGIEAAEKISVKKKIPILFMTGYTTESIKERAQKVNPVGFLEKPVSIDRIKEILDTINSGEVVISKVNMMIGSCKGAEQ
jgi:CheY-like chemotaxis protein